MPVNDPVAYQRLQAMANGGSSEVQAWDAARAAAQAQQQKALGAVAPLALNGPAESAALAGIINKYAAPVNTAIGSGSAQAGQNDANYAVAGKSYLDRAMRKLDMERQQNEQELALKRQLGQQDYDVSVAQQQLKDQELQFQQLQAATGGTRRSGSSSSGGMTKEEVKDAVEGRGQAAMEEANAATRAKLDETIQQYINDQSKSDDLMTARGLVDKANRGEQLSDVERRVVDKIGKTYGIDLNSLLNPLEAKTPEGQVGGSLSWEGNVPTFQGRDPNSSFSGAGGPATNGPLQIRGPEPQIDPNELAQRNAQLAALDAATRDATTAAGRMVGDTWVPSYVPKEAEKFFLGIESPGIIANQPGRQGPQVKGWQPGFQQAALDAVARQNYIDLPLFQQQAAVAGGMDPYIAQGMFPYTPKEQVARSKEYDDLQDYADKQSVSDRTRETKEKKQAIDQQVEDAAAAAGMPVDRFKEIQKTTNLSTEKLATMLTDDNGQGSTDAQFKALADQVATEAQSVAATPNPTKKQLDAAADPINEYKKRVGEAYDTAKAEGRIPEGLTRSDYLLLANQYTAILSGLKEG